MTKRDLLPQDTFWFPLSLQEEEEIYRKLNPQRENDCQAPVLVFPIRYF
jgi:hypothetical protein